MNCGSLGQILEIFNGINEIRNLEKISPGKWAKSAGDPAPWARIEQADRGMANWAIIWWLGQGDGPAPTVVSAAAGHAMVVLLLMPLFPLTPLTNDIFLLRQAGGSSGLLGIGAGGVSGGGARSNTRQRQCRSIRRLVVVRTTECSGTCVEGGRIGPMRHWKKRESEVLTSDEDSNSRSDGARAGNSWLGPTTASGAQLRTAAVS
jgi:hypothetical protein